MNEGDAGNLPPQSAADPRPGGQPYYINSDCPDCGASLVLLDVLERPNVPAGEIWYDEFICPDCRQGIHLDVPEMERINK